MRVHFESLLSVDVDVIFHRNNTWCRPSGALSEVSFIPCFDFSIESDLPVEDGNSNGTCLEFGVVF
jgi:hypothetical protein